MNGENRIGNERDKKEGEEVKKLEKRKRETEDTKMMNMLIKKMQEMQTEYDVCEHIVVDLGNAITKVGFSGEDLPILEIPSIYGFDLEKKNELNFEAKSQMFGYDALDAKISDPSISLKYLKPGDFKNLIDLEFCDFLKDIFETRLNKTPADYKVIVNVQPNKNFDNFSRITKMFLDDLGFKAISIMNSASLALFSSGRTSGLVVDCGETRSYVTPIFEGFPLYHAFNKNKIGGKDLTDIIANGIKDNNLSVDHQDLRSLRIIKEKTLSIPYLQNVNYYLNSENDIISPEKMLYKLPDDTVINIPKRSRLLASEVLFNPSIMGRSDRGLCELIADSIKKSVIDNDDLKKIMSNNIVLSGGTTMIPGFQQRIKSTFMNSKEIEFNNLHNAQVIAEGNRNIATWIGASMIASMSSFDKMFIKKADFLENGEERIPLFSRII